MPWCKHSQDATKRPIGLGGKKKCLGKKVCVFFLNSLSTVSLFYFLIKVIHILMHILRSKERIFEYIYMYIYIHIFEYVCIGDTYTFIYSYISLYIYSIYNVCVYICIYITSNALSPTFATLY